MINEIDADGSGTVDFEGKQFPFPSIMSMLIIFFSFDFLPNTLCRIHGDDDRRISSYFNRSSSPTRFTPLPAKRVAKNKISDIIALVPISNNKNIQPIFSAWPPISTSSLRSSWRDTRVSLLGIQYEVFKRLPEAY